MTLHSVVDPATEDVVTEVESLDVAQVDAAVARAVAAGPAWRAVAPADRARLLRRFAAAVDAHVDELADLEVRGAGHTVGNARWEAGNVRDVLDYYAAAPERLFGRQIPVAGGLDVTFREPLGVVGIIVPWNFPMPIAGWGFAPALAAGNTVVLKPAELTPLTALRLAELGREAGLPDDVFTVLPGKGSVVGERLVTHEQVRKIVFTGSTAVGTGILRRAADQVKRVTLELGGKSANIVFADADVEKAAANAPAGVFDNAGQDCCARSRILVQRPVYDRFLELLEPAVTGLRVGPPGKPDTEMGPLISAEQRERVRGFVESGADAGGRPVDVAFRGSGSDRPRVLVPADRRAAALDRRPGLARGGVRPGGRRAAVRRRGRRRRAGQRHRVRPVRLDLDPRRRPRAAGGARGGERQPVGELELLGAVLDAVRRVQAVRAGPRARPGRAGLVHRAEERLHADD